MVQLMLRNLTHQNKTVTRIYNRHFDKEKRQYLRNNSPKAEALLWQKIRRRQVANIKFRRQYGIERFVLDFYSPHLNLAIEIDGPTHIGREVKKYDQCRQSFVESLGIRFLRFTNEEIYEDINSVVGTIYQKIVELQQENIVGSKSHKLS